MKRSSPDQDYTIEIEATNKMLKGDDEWDDDWDWERDFPKEESDDFEVCSESEDEDDQEVLDAAYVKEHFDRLYVDKVVLWVEEGKNVFVTGSPGRGKSTCMNRVIEKLYDKGTKLIVTGSTGAAVVNIGNDALSQLTKAVDRERIPNELLNTLAPTTVHSAFGLRKVENDHMKQIGEGSGASQSFMSFYIKRHNAERRKFLASNRGAACVGVPSVAHADVLILDEVSMVSGIMVEILDGIAKFWRDAKYQHLPFGGIVMVFVGDFQQLPPVGSGTRQNPVFLFENSKWTTKTSKGGWVDRVLLLKTNIRQEGDLEYGALLDRMATNSLSDDDVSLLKKCVLKSTDGADGKALAMNPYVMPFVPRIFTSNRDITQYTEQVLKEIDNKKIVELNGKEKYEPNKETICRVYGKENVQKKTADLINKTTKNCDTRFFVDCPVRFLENRDILEGVVNGAIGKFKGLADRDGHPVIQLMNGNKYILTPSSETIYLDDYKPYERRMIQSGRLRPNPNRPVAKLTYSYYNIKTALGMTVYAMQGCTLDTAIIHPNVAATHEFTIIQALLVALSRLRSSGMDYPDKQKTVMVTPKATLWCEDGGPRPLGLYLTRFATYPFYVASKVREYIDNIFKRHGLFGSRENGNT